MKGMRSIHEWAGGSARRRKQLKKFTIPVADAGRNAIGGENTFTIPVAMRPGETPVLIPNTMVKTRAADGTMLETAWESRWLPD